jgi:transposase-like protein
MAHHPRSFWEGLLAEVHHGESIEAVARRHQVRPRTLKWWRWRLRRDESRARPRAPRLLPVVVRHAPVIERAPSDLAIVVADLRVHFQVGADIGYVAALIGSLRRSC